MRSSEFVGERQANRQTELSVYFSAIGLHWTTRRPPKYWYRSWLQGPVPLFFLLWDQEGVEHKVGWRCPTPFWKPRFLYMSKMVTVNGRQRAKVSFVWAPACFALNKKWWMIAFLEWDKVALPVNAPILCPRGSRTVKLSLAYPHIKWSLFQIGPRVGYRDDIRDRAKEIFGWKEGRKEG